MKLVSSQDLSGREIERAKNAAHQELRTMTANLLRIISGSGEPAGLPHQIVRLEGLLQDLCKLEGHTASPDFIKNALALSSSVDPDVDRENWGKGHEREMQRSELGILRDALRVVAADYGYARHVLSNAERRFHESLRYWCDAWEARKRAAR